MTFFTTRMLMSALLVSSLSTPLFAQEELSVEELAKRFEQQREAFKAAQSNALGATRGLKLITLDNSDAEASPQTSATAQQGAATAVTAADPNKPLVFGRLDQDLQVNLRISFGFDSAALSSGEAPKLEKMCQVLKQSDIGLVRIVGHTDTSGSEAYNKRLSVLRAEEVARHLIDNCGIDPKRLETLGMGEQFPYNPSDPRADENRRVEFQALS